MDDVYMYGLCYKMLQLFPHPITHQNYSAALHALPPRVALFCCVAQLG